MVELLNIDCIEYMANCPDNHFNLAIVDPIYGGVTQGGYMSNNSTGAAKSKDYNTEIWKQAKTNDAYFTEVFRVSKNQIIWGGNYFPLPPCRCFIAWNKVRKIKNFSNVEYAWTSFDEPAQVFTYCNNAGFILSENDRPRTHPTQKPVSLYEWLLKNYAKPGDRILDTHFGSLSIGIACYNLGFDLTAYEIDKEYFNAGKLRLENHMKKGRLFETVNGRVVPTQKALI